MKMVLKKSFWQSIFITTLFSSSLAQKDTRDVILNIPDSENGAGLSSNGRVYFSSLYRASVVEYDPIRKWYREIRIPGISGNPLAHVSGIKADSSRNIIWAIANPAFAFGTYGANLTGPEGLISINLAKNIINYVNLHPALEQVKAIKREARVGGGQDLAVAPDGSVYTIVSFGQVIIKVNPRTSDTSVFYTPAGLGSRGLTYTGVELLQNRILIVWNTAEGQFETFDITSKQTKRYPKVVRILNLNQFQLKKIFGDAVYAPSFANGRCLLLSNDGAKTIEVFTSTDGWNSAIHRSSINAGRYGGYPAFTYETFGKIYFGQCFFDDGPYGGNRRIFPQGDITNEVREACRI